MLFVFIALTLFTFFLCCTTFGFLQAHGTYLGSEGSLPQEPLDDTLHLCVWDYLGHRHLSSMAHGTHSSGAIFQFLVLGGVKAFDNLELDAAKAARELATWSQRGLVHQSITKLAEQGWRKAARIILLAFLLLLRLGLVGSLRKVVDGVDACSLDQTSHSLIHIGSKLLWVSSGYLPLLVLWNAFEFTWVVVFIVVLGAIVNKMARHPTSVANVGIWRL